MQSRMVIFYHDNDAIQLECRCIAIGGRNTKLHSENSNRFYHECGSMRNEFTCSLTIILFSKMLLLPVPNFMALIAEFCASIMIPGLCATTEFLRLPCKRRIPSNEDYARAEAKICR